MKARRLTSPWPFAESIVNGKLVRNIQPKPVKPPKPTRLKPVPPSSAWQQEALL